MPEYPSGPVVPIAVQPPIPAPPPIAIVHEPHPQLFKGPAYRPRGMAARVSQLMGDGEHGVWHGLKFHPPPRTRPHRVFVPRCVRRGYGPTRGLFRFCVNENIANFPGPRRSMALFTSAYSITEGRTVLATWAFAYCDRPSGKADFDSTVAGPLELRGPYGDETRVSQERAQLRAVVAALRIKPWWVLGWDRVVIATDSDYVAKNAVDKLQSWAEGGWQHPRTGKPVENADLWRSLGEALGTYATQGYQVAFYKIPRRYNNRVITAARDALDSWRGHLPLEKYRDLWMHYFV